MNVLIFCTLYTHNELKVIMSTLTILIEAFILKFLSKCFIFSVTE